MDNQARDDMKKEAFVMKELTHPCIVRLYGISQSRKLGSILMVCLAHLLELSYGYLFHIIISESMARMHRKTTLLVLFS